jgi:hypothetical protein
VFGSCELVSGTEGTSRSGRSFGLGSIGLGAGTMGLTSCGVAGRGIRGGINHTAEDVAMREKHSRECGNIWMETARLEFGYDGEVLRE